MTDIEIINQMIKDTAKVEMIEKDNKFSVELIEPSIPDCCVTIHGMPADAVVIKADKFPSPDSIFAGLKHECKRADYIIVAEKESKKRIIYIEMKRKHDNPAEIVAQLTGALCFIRYCQAIGRSFWKDRNFLNDFQHRFVSIEHIRIGKKRTRIERKASLHDTPEKRMIIKRPSRLEFNNLAGS